MRRDREIGIVALDLLAGSKGDSHVGGNDHVRRCREVDVVSGDREVRAIPFDLLGIIPKGQSDVGWYVDVVCGGQIDVCLGCDREVGVVSFNLLARAKRDAHVGGNDHVRHRC